MLQRRSIPNGPVFYASPLLEDSGVAHAFSTRLGGVSPAPFDSLNLGNPSGCDRQDDDDRIQQNYQLLQHAIDRADVRRCWVHQVHGAAVLDVSSDQFENGLKADALVTNQPDRVLAVRVADCVPILIADDTGRTVAAVHAGWRGVVAQIIPAAVRRMRELTPSLEPHRLIAAIGPCIGFESFEVGPEVLAKFLRVFGSDAPTRRDDEKTSKGHVDLAAACRLQLLEAGLDEHRIDTTDRCTFRDSQEFFSHRRDNGVTGRMAALISPRPR